MIFPKGKPIHIYINATLVIWPIKWDKKIIPFLPNLNFSQSSDSISNANHG